MEMGNIVNSESKLKCKCVKTERGKVDLESSFVPLNVFHLLVYTRDISLQYVSTACTFI